MSDESPKVPPDYRLRIKDHNGRTANVGAAWRNDKGHLRLYLDPGVCLNWRDLDGSMLTLFPNDREG